jgi:hypothetical protein
LCHALIDHSTEPKVSAESNRTELVEVRANAFAAAFLLPKGGVESFLSARDKGSVSREEQIVYDPSTEHGVQNVRAEKRTAAWLQAITFQDVASLSHCFGVSYSAATYRLKALGKLNNDELTRLLSEQNSGRQFLRLLRIGNDLESSDDPRRRDRELVSQVASLCLEAYRREQIKRRDVLAICRLLRVPGRQLLESADAALARAVAN